MKLERIFIPTHPTSGIKAWKSPNRKLICNITRHSLRPKITPLTIDTVKQSIARAIANRIISKSPILLYSSINANAKVIISDEIIVIQFG